MDLPEGRVGSSPTAYTPRGDLDWHYTRLARPDRSECAQRAETMPWISRTGVGGGGGRPRSSFVPQNVGDEACVLYARGAHRHPAGVIVFVTDAVKVCRKARRPFQGPL